MDKKYENGSKAKAFMKKNMYYFIIGACIVAIGAMIAVALIVKDDSSPSTGEPLNDTPAVVDPIDQPAQDTPIVDPVPDNPTPVVDPKDPEPIVFTSPVANGNVLREYNMATVVYWSTLKHYAVHGGLDLGGEENAPVVAAYDGTVSKVSYDALNGNVVTIDHGNGLITTYGSLENVSVTEGQKVTTGYALGTIGTSATNEMLDGAHVHFCAYENGKAVDPYEYLPTGAK